MGRPKKNKEEKRDIQIVVKLTKAEHKRLRELIAHAETNASDVVRQLVFKDRILRPRTPLLNAKTFIQLKRIGNNLNQYMKASVHQSKNYELDRQIVEELQETLELIGESILKL